MQALAISALVGLMAGEALPTALEPWAPVFALGGEQSAVMTIADLLRFSEAFNTRRQLDLQTQKLVDAVSENLDQLDIDALYALVPDHRLNVFGRLVPSGAYSIRSTPVRRFGRFGDVRVHAALEDVGQKTYRIRADADVHVRLNRNEMFDMATQSLDWVRTTAGKVDTNRPRGMDRADYLMLGRIRAAFPNSMRYFEKYASITDLVAPGARVRLQMRLDREALHRDYPELAATAVLAERIYRGRARIYTTTGKLLGVAQMNSGTPDVVLSFVPNMRVLDVEKFTAVLDLEGKVAGVKVRIGGLRVDNHVVRDTRGTRIVSRMRKMPRIRVMGGSLIDAFIPSDLESIVQEVFRTIVRSNKGEGARWSITFPEQRRSPVRLASQVDFVSNGFVTFAMSVLSKLEIGTDVVAGVQHITRDAMAEFGKDFLRFQAALPRQ